jgi:cytochrome d ubiquinol oxidase subunit II
MEFLQITWFYIIVFLFAGYAILDGYDLGIGILTPFLAKNDDQKRTLFNAIGPVWDGNEVWLITAGASLFAAFPPVYATVFSGFYLPLMLVLLGLIFRAVSLEFWSYDPQNRKLWTIALVVGSFLPSLLYGVALGNVILGIPLNGANDFTGNFFTLLRPFPLVAGVVGLLAILLQGAAFTVHKTAGEIRRRAMALTSTIWWGFLLSYIVMVVMGAIALDGAISQWTAWMFALLAPAALFFIRWFLKKGDDFKVFLSSSLVHVNLWGLMAAVHFPRLVKVSNDPGLGMTIYNSSSGPLTLKVMTLIAAIGMPVVIGYSIFVHKVFRGKVNSGD